MKKIILLKSTSSEYLKRFRIYVASHYKVTEMKEINGMDEPGFNEIENIGCFGSRIREFLSCNKSEVLIIHNPTTVINLLLNDIDLITSAIDFELYRIYLGNDRLPENYDEQLGESKYDFFFPLEEQIDKVLEMEN